MTQVQSPAVVATTCTTCKKNLNIAPASVGRTIKCPYCHEKFVAFLATPKKIKEAKFHFSMPYILIAVTVVVVPTILATWKYGPQAVQDKWAQQLPIATSDVQDVVTRAMHFSETGGESFAHITSAQLPHALDINFLFGPMYFSMPPVVGFVGTTTEGAVVGKYFTATGEIEADAETGGLAMPGTGVMRHGQNKIHVTGRNHSGNVTVEVNGKTIHSTLVN